MDSRTYTVRIGVLGSTSVQASSKWHAEDQIWNRVQSGDYGALASKKLTRQDICVV